MIVTFFLRDNVHIVIAIEVYGIIVTRAFSASLHRFSSIQNKMNRP